MLDTKGIEDRFIDAHELTTHMMHQCGDDDGSMKNKLGDLVRWRGGDYKSAEFLSQDCLDVDGRWEFSMTRPTRVNELAWAVKIGRCFGGASGSWALYVALMVLGFAERLDSRPESVWEGLRELVDESRDLKFRFPFKKQSFAGLTWAGLLQFLTSTNYHPTI